MKIQSLFFAGILAISPLSAVVAQSTGPDMKAGGAAEADSVKNGAAKNPGQPGATGSTVVPGNQSTVAADHKGTYEQKTGQTAGGGR
jgi:hypothetical protein